MQFRNNCFLVALVAAAVLVGTAGFAQADLIAHWAFDEEGENAGTAFDTSGSATTHNGTVDVSSGIRVYTGQTFAKIGKSYFFAGAADPDGDGGVEVPHAADIDTFTNATFCGWLYYSDNEHLYKPLFSKWGGAESYNIRVYMEYLTMQVRTKSPDLQFIRATNPNQFTLSNWHHVAVKYTGVTYDSGSSGTATATLYVNGVEIISDSDTGQTGMPPTEDSLWLGTFEKTGASAASFDGYLDDLGIWDEALTDGKIGALYNVVEDLELAYNLSDMKKLFKVFDDNTPHTIGGLDWERDNNLPDPTAVDPEAKLGFAWTAGGYHYVWLDNGSYQGVKAVIPEPSTLLLLTTGLLGLLAYAWRKRK